MPTLFSYCLRYDGGSAPNPFWGLCTLAICKPQIRRAAQVGDWVVGTGSAVSPMGDISEMVVYAMRVSQKMTMQDYDAFTRFELPAKIPDLKSREPRRRIGDSLYDFSTPVPRLRPGVHGEGNRDTDLGGGWVLLSEHFYYFGNRPVALPQALLGIVRRGQGHRSTANAPYVEDFVRWIDGLGYAPASIIGSPQHGYIAKSRSMRNICIPNLQPKTEAARPESSPSCEKLACLSSPMRSVC